MRTRRIIAIAVVVLVEVTGTGSGTGIGCAISEALVKRQADEETVLQIASPNIKQPHHMELFPYWCCST